MTVNYEILQKRNPVIVLTNSSGKTFTIQTIGDPHLGRNFRNNLRHRLGDREQTIKDDFNRLLNTESDITVVMGDLLDKVVITNEWFSFTLKSLKDNATANPNKKYYILNGNHDEVKDKTRVSSFSLIVEYFKRNPIPNLFFVTEECLSVTVDDFNLDLVFTNYDPFKKEFNFTYNKENLKIAFGHFDVDLFDYIDKTKFIDHTIPESIDQNFDLIVNGHFHKPCFLKSKEHNTPILITGSMQPYAFSEEIVEDGNLYITIPIQEARNILEQDSEFFSQSNVRILYEKGDELLEPFNAFSIIYKLINNKVEVLEVQQPDKALSFSQIFLNILNDNRNALNEDIIKEIEQRFLDKDYESD